MEGKKDSVETKRKHNTSESQRKKIKRYTENDCEFWVNGSKSSLRAKDIHVNDIKTNQLLNIKVIDAVKT